MRQILVMGPSVLWLLYLTSCRPLNSPHIQDVICQVDPSTPNLDPRLNIYFGLPSNRGKRSVLLDVKTAECAL